MQRARTSVDSTAAAQAAPGGARPLSPAALSCANCGAAIAGRYCAACGQRVEEKVHSLGHFIREATEDLTHADSRLWRTLIALSLHPGHLTREFLAGRRARYLPPVRLYLVLSVAFFLLASLEPSRAGLVVIRAGGEPVVVVAPGGSARGAGSAGSSSAQRPDQLCARADAGPFAGYLDPAKVRAACRAVLLDGGRSLRAAILHNVPRALFIFLPLIAGVMQLLYQDRFYIEHLLFLVHNHAFIFLLFGVCGLLAFTPAGGAVPTLDSIAFVYVLWYVYRALRRVYGEGRLRTVGKFAALALSYAVCAVVMLALTALYSIETLAAAAG